jgi:hypothetical protein
VTRDTANETRLKKAIARLRRVQLGGPRPPSPALKTITLQQATALEALILERISMLQAEVASIKDQQRWLTRLVGGAVLAAILDLVLR